MVARIDPVPGGYLVREYHCVKSPYYGANHVSAMTSKNPFCAYCGRRLWRAGGSDALFCHRLIVEEDPM